MRKIEFEPSQAITYADGSGEDVACVFIELSEPTGKVAHICMEIEGIIQSSAAKMSAMLSEDELQEAKDAAKERKKNDEEPERMDADTAIALMNSSGADMNKVVILCRELFNEVGMIDGTKKLTKPMMDRMAYTDMRRMIGEYIANFILS